MAKRSRLQEFVSRRNWTKARILTAMSILNTNKDVLTELEKTQLDIAQDMYKAIIEYWDDNTKLLIQDFKDKDQFTINFVKGE